MGEAVEQAGALGRLSVAAGGEGRTRRSRPPRSFSNWGDAAAAFDPCAAAARIADALTAALAAEGLNGEAGSCIRLGEAEMEEKARAAPTSATPSDLAIIMDEDDAKSAADLTRCSTCPCASQPVLGKANLSVAQLLKLGAGSVLELDRKVGEAIDVYVNNRLVARGEVVVVDDRLGVTMTEIIKDGDAA
jgi:flagellar motor switch protein FliN/FliY